MGEHLPCKQGVMGSNPIISTSGKLPRPLLGEVRGNSIRRVEQRKIRENLLLFTSHLLPHLYGGVAQLGEHLPCKQGVKGSIPFISTNGE